MLWEGSLRARGLRGGGRAHVSLVAPLALADQVVLVLRLEHLELLLRQLELDERLVGVGRPLHAEECRNEPPICRRQL